jgi:hypothetical protein
MYSVRSVLSILLPFCPCTHIHPVALLLLLLPTPLRETVWQEASVMGRKYLPVVERNNKDGEGPL